MIQQLKEPNRPTGVVYESMYNQMRMIHDKDPALAGELALSAIELILSGEISTDNDYIKVLLEGMKPVVSKAKERYDKTVEIKREEKIKKYNLAEIALLLRQGWTQNNIAAKLGISKQTLSHRINKMIKVDFPELLEENGQKEFLTADRNCLTNECDKSKNFLTSDGFSQKNLNKNLTNDDVSQTSQIKSNENFLTFEQTSQKNQMSQIKNDLTLSASSQTSQMSQIHDNDNVHDNVNDFPLDYFTGEILGVSLSECKGWDNKEIIQEDGETYVKNLDTNMIYKIFDFNKKL